ncbi:MAG: hypothetical protein IAE79_24955 [Anaerolinea sp.]|nr:hypothetical protein [Anaerolinea sp.]
MKKQALLIVIFILCCLPQIAFAAEDAVSVNPPGWLGGTLALLSLALAIGVGAWARNKK